MPRPKLRSNSDATATGIIRCVIVSSCVQQHQCRSQGGVPLVVVVVGSNCVASTGRLFHPLVCHVPLKLSHSSWRHFLHFTKGFPFGGRLRFSRKPQVEFSFSAGHQLVGIAAKKKGAKTKGATSLWRSNNLTSQP